jgi:hypothetical protein
MKKLFKIDVNRLTDKLEDFMYGIGPLLVIPIYIIFIGLGSVLLTNYVAVAWFKLPYYWEFGPTDYILASILFLLIWLCMYLQRVNSSKDYPERILLFFRDSTYFSPAAREKLNSYSGTNAHKIGYYSVPEFKSVVLIVDKKKVYWIYPERKGRKYFSDIWVMVDVNEIGIWIAEKSSLYHEGYKDFAMDVGGRTLIPWNSVLRLKVTNEDWDVIAGYKNSLFSSW